MLLATEYTVRWGFVDWMTLLGVLCLVALVILVACAAVFGRNWDD